MCGSFFLTIIRETQLWQKQKKQPFSARTAAMSQQNGWASVRRAENGIRLWRNRRRPNTGGKPGARKPQRSGQKAGASDGNFNRKRRAYPDGNRRTRPGARRRNRAGFPDTGRRRSGNWKIHTPSAGVPHAVHSRTSGFIHFRRGVPAPDQTARRADRRI